MDVQRTAAANDQTDSACLKSLPNKYCIGLCCILLLLSTYLPLLHQMTSIDSIVSLVNLAKSQSIHNRNNNNDNKLSRNNNNNNQNHNNINNEINDECHSLSTANVVIQSLQPRYVHVHHCWWLVCELRNLGRTCHLIRGMDKLE